MPVTAILSFMRWVLLNAAVLLQLLVHGRNCEIRKKLLTGHTWKNAPTLAREWLLSYILNYEECAVATYVVASDNIPTPTPCCRRKPCAPMQISPYAQQLITTVQFKWKRTSQFYLSLIMMYTTLCQVPGTRYLIFSLNQPIASCIFV